MSMSMPTGVVEGTSLTVMPFRPTAVIGTMSLPTYISLVPSPSKEENKRAMAQAGGSVKRHAEIRALVQRMLQGTNKGKNVLEYADYAGAAFRGDLGTGWSMPPVTLWLADEPGAIGENELVAGTGIRTLTIASGSPVVAIDGETQTAALHEIYDNPEEYSLAYRDLATVRIPFELYWGLTIEDARQIFYDRNVKGVPVAKNLAMSMDQRDYATKLAHQIADSFEVEHNGAMVPFTKLVQARKRQLGVNDPEVVTLSALRALVVTTLLGRSGISMTSGTVTEDTVSLIVHDEVKIGEVPGTVVPLLAGLLSDLFPHFAKRTMLSAPAVLTGLGIAVHQATGLTQTADSITPAELTKLLNGIRWEKEPAFWSGVAGNTNVHGKLTIGGGAKDSGGRVADAILYPNSTTGRQIRGQ
jgi:hypothetical protein